MIIIYIGVRVVRYGRFLSWTDVKQCFTTWGRATLWEGACTHCSGGASTRFEYCKGI